MGEPIIGRIAGLVAMVCTGAIVLSGITHAGDATQYWSVTGVASDDVLNMRDVPHGDSKKLGAIPPNAHGLKSLGCMRPEPSLDRWMDMTEDEKKNAKLEWCRVEYKGHQGWVAARFLKPDAAPR